MDTTTRAAPPDCSATSSSWAGLWHSMIASARSASSAFEPTAAPPIAAASASALAESTSATRAGSPMPRAKAEAMFPAPMNPSFIPAGKPIRPRARSESRKQSLPRNQSRRPGGPRQGPMTPAADGLQPLGLVEEALFDETRPLFRGDLHVARREQEDLVRDALHAAVECVREPGREVDQPLREVRVRRLEVEDDRDRVLELVRDLLGVVEALWDDEVHLDLAARSPTAPVAPDRPQDARFAAAAARLVGEDVVELVAPAALEAPHVRPVAVAVLELDLRLGLRQRLVARVLLLSEAEVDERAMPCVAKRHAAGKVRP